MKTVNYIKIKLLLLFIGFAFWNCNKQVKSEMTAVAPVFDQADAKYANVYKILDGTWKGQFNIYQDANPVSATEVDLENLRIEQIQSPNLELINSIDVTQVYTSESPYYQTVTITDIYPDTGKKEISTGANKIENGKMWCIVNKPSEKIIHNGKTRGDNTIIWYQKNQNPQKVEYFQETVDEAFYEIIGYGYYEGDDITLSPKLWFYGKYERQ